MREFMQLLKREFKMFFRNTTLMMVFLGAPLIYAVMLASVYKSGKVTNIPILVVDGDNSPMSLQLIEMLEDNEGLSVVRVLPESTNIQSQMIDYNAVAVVEIPHRFEADVLQARYPEVNVYNNTVNLLTANFAGKDIQVTLGTFAAGVEIKTLQKRGMPVPYSYQRYEPFKQNIIKVFNETGNYFTFMWPAMLAVVLQQVILLAMAVSIAFEVENNTFGMGIVSKTKSAISTVLVKVFPLWILSIPLVFIFYLFHLYYNAPLPTHPINYVIMTGFFVVATTFLGTMISALLPNALKATQVLMVMSAPGFIIGGYTWPLESMALPIQWLASSLPLTPFLESFKLMLMQDATLSQVTPQMIHLVIQIVIYFAISLLLVKWRINREAKKMKYMQRS